MINIISSFQNYVLFEILSYYKYGDEMINKPTMFVNSVFFDNDINPNQIIYDSRIKLKNKVYHRIDDIKCFLLLNRRVYVTIRSKSFFYEGVVLFLDNKTIKIKNNDNIIGIMVKDIAEIKVINIS